MKKSTLVPSLIALVGTAIMFSPLGFIMWLLLGHAIASHNLALGIMSSILLVSLLSAVIWAPLAWVQALERNSWRGQPSQSRTVDVRNIKYQFVTDLVSKRMTDAPKAFHIVGSNGTGSKGYEQIAFSAKYDAATSPSENGGGWIVLDEVACAARAESNIKGSRRDNRALRPCGLECATPIVELITIRSEERTIGKPTEEPSLKEDED